jgi:hypothetical protein
VASYLTRVGHDFATAPESAFLGEVFGLLVHGIAQGAAIGHALAESASVTHYQKNQVFAGATSHHPALQFNGLTNPTGQVPNRLRFHRKLKI